MPPPAAGVDLQALYNKNLHQVTIHATITDSTPRKVATIAADAHDGPSVGRPAGTAPAPVFSDLVQAPIWWVWVRDHGIGLLS